MHAIIAKLLLKITIAAIMAVSAHAAAFVTVRHGDTLSRIGQQHELSLATVESDNRELVNYNVILPGQRVWLVPGHEHAAPVLAPAALPANPTPPVPQPVAVSAAPVSTSGDSAFEQCVVARESGGNAQVMNSSGHYGLFQFSYSTWVGYGGSPAAFGDATPAQQQAVFSAAMAGPDGAANWAPSDGC